MRLLYEPCCGGKVWGKFCMILECAVDVEERRRGVKGKRKYEVKLIELFLRRCYPWFFLRWC